jgi:hypothetical protein
VPALVLRVEAARARRRDDGVTARTFFHDGAGRPWKDADAFRDVFNELRDRLNKQHPYCETRYYVGADPEDPLRLPTKKLTMQTMRHTCITLNHDAGVPRELIRAITGHELDTIDQVLKMLCRRDSRPSGCGPQHQAGHTRGSPSDLSYVSRRKTRT